MQDYQLLIRQTVSAFDRYLEQINDPSTERVSRDDFIDAVMHSINMLEHLDDLLTIQFQERNNRFRCDPALLRVGRPVSPRTLDAP